MSFGCIKECWREYPCDLCNQISDVSGETTERESKCGCDLGEGYKPYFPLQLFPTSEIISKYKGSNTVILMPPLSTGIFYGKSLKRKQRASQVFFKIAHPEIVLGCPKKHFKEWNRKSEHFSHNKVLLCDTCNFILMFDHKDQYISYCGLRV